MKAVAKFSNGTKSITIMRYVKEGTKRVFFFPVTGEGKRLDRIGYGKMWEAKKLGYLYLKS